VPTRGIPFPAGDPDLGPAQERAWRRQLLEGSVDRDELVASLARSGLPRDDTVVDALIEALRPAT